jgi:hypothetical protein
MQELKDAIDRLNRAISALEKRRIIKEEVIPAAFAILSQIVPGFPPITFEPNIGNPWQQSESYYITGADVMSANDIAIWEAALVEWAEVN